MTDRGVTTEQFEQWRRHLKSVAYGMLGSVSDAEDAVQECWLRLDRRNPDGINDLRAWLTTVVSRICLDILRTRKASRSDYVDSWLPEPLVSTSPDDGPEQAAVMADGIGMALLIVLEQLSPPERLAFVLHDVFGMPFDEIAVVVERTPEAARQLASRARRRVQSAPEPDPDLPCQRRVVDAFLAAARQGDFDALVAVLDPEVVIRFDVGATGTPAFSPVRGAEAVAARVLATAPRFIGLARPVLVNGAAGAFFGTPEQPRAVLSFTIVAGRIAALDLVANPDKLRRVHIDA